MGSAAPQFQRKVLKRMLVIMVAWGEKENSCCPRNFHNAAQVNKGRLKSLGAILSLGTFPVTTRSTILFITVLGPQLYKNRHCSK